MMTKKEIVEQIKKIEKRVTNIENKNKNQQCQKGQHGNLTFYDARAFAPPLTGSYIRYHCLDCGNLIRKDLVGAALAALYQPEIIRLFKKT